MRIYVILVPPTEIRPRIDRRNSHLLHIPPHRIARQGAEFRSQQHLDFARPIKQSVHVDLVNPMLDRHLARRWCNGLIVEARAAEAQQRGLRRERQLRGVALDQRLPLPQAQAGSFSEKRPDTGSRLPGAQERFSPGGMSHAAGLVFFSQFSCVVRRPISAYRSSSCFSWAACWSARLSRRS